MPRRGGNLAIGAGIAQGANAFVQSFMQAKQLEQQEKLQKNAFIVQMLARQLEDDNLPYYERAKILDSIPQLVGAKTDRPLSQMLGLDKFNEEEVQTGTKKVNNPVPEGGTHEELIQDVQANTGKGSTSDAAVMEKQGNLTPAILKHKLILATEAAKDAGDLKKQEASLRLNYKLQSEILGKGGYNQKVFEGRDEQGNYLITMSNGRDHQVINLGKVTPTQVIKAQLSVDKPSSFVKEREDYWESQGFSPEDSNKKALEDAHNKFVLKQKTGEAYVTSIEQGIKGTKPPTASAKLADDDRDRAYVTKLQQDASEQQAEMVAAKKEVDRLGKEKTKVGKEVSLAIQKLADLEGSVSPDDQRYKDARKDLKDKEDKYDGLETEFGKFVVKESEAKMKLSGTNYMLRESSTQGGDPTIRQAIQKFKENNPEANKTDEEILVILKEAGILK